MEGRQYSEDGKSITTTTGQKQTWIFYGNSRQV